MIKLTIPGYNQYGHYDRDATLEEVIAWLQEKGVGEEVIGFPFTIEMDGNPPVHSYTYEYPQKGDKPTHLVIPLEEE